MKNVVFPLNCIILPLHAHAVTKVVAATSTPSHCSNSTGHDCHILPFIDIEAEDYIEHVIDKEEEGTENDKSSYKASMHGFTLNALITL